MRLHNASLCLKCACTMHHCAQHVTLPAQSDSLPLLHVRCEQGPPCRCHKVQSRRWALQSVSALSNLPQAGQSSLCRQAQPSQGQSWLSHQAVHFHICSPLFCTRARAQVPTFLAHLHFLQVHFTLSDSHHSTECFHCCHGTPGLSAPPGQAWLPVCISGGAHSGCKQIAPRRDAGGTQHSNCCARSFVFYRL